MNAELAKMIDSVKMLYKPLDTHQDKHNVDH